ncbi:MAG: magnesium transporter CorA family protein [Proteobacteria bacterium]|nr:magnesium transporter CorA family protein [Pseudomonadota bacterium]
MLSVYTAGARGLQRSVVPAGTPIPDDAVWLDLLEPSVEEERQVEQALGIDVPTREEMREIETSNRLYEDNGALYMTSTVLTKADTPVPETTQVTFILTGSRLVTNRYADLLAFRHFATFAETHPAVCSSASLLLTGLLEAIVNRVADVLERVGAEIDGSSLRVFPRGAALRAARHDYQNELRSIGQSGELISKARESLLSLTRLLGFLQQSNDGKVSPEARASTVTVSRDAAALSDHATFLVGKTQFLLDATLGLVTIDQNNILKIFSVVTVLLLPPSVIGAFYGMNFEHIPWLHERWGVWAALGMMVVSALAPYLYFKSKRWL